jgi:hypothetical protein
MQARTCGSTRAPFRQERGAARDIPPGGRARHRHWSEAASRLQPNQGARFMKSRAHFGDAGRPFEPCGHRRRAWAHLDGVRPQARPPRRGRRPVSQRRGGKVVPRIRFDLDPKDRDRSELNAPMNESIEKNRQTRNRPSWLPAVHEHKAQQSGDHPRAPVNERHHQRAREEELPT